MCVHTEARPLGPVEFAKGVGFKEETPFAGSQAN